MMGKFSFNDLVLKFDVVTNAYLSNHQEIHKFLEILREASLNKKYEFVFPLFYNFTIAEDRIDLLRSTTGESYEWLIRNSVQSQVDKHSSYGIGITESYCKSDIGPSYLEIRKSKEADKTLYVKIVRYEDRQFENAALLLSEEEPLDKLEVKSVNETTNAKVKSFDDWNVIFEDSENKEFIKGIKENNDFIKGIKAHYPIIEDGERFLYYFFSNNLKAKETDEKQYGFGGLFVISKGELDVLELGFFILSGYTLANKVALSQIQRSARIESIKSAKAAIMSRNMSHNLGSHVMAYLKNDLRNVSSIFASDVLRNLFPDEFKDNTDSIANKVPSANGAGLRDEFKDNTDSIANKVELPFLVGLGGFIGYLQERQDYIATIASSYIPPFSPVNFKDSIYDELNPDLRFERHHGNDPHNHNRPQNILLSYIAKSEKLSRIKSKDSPNHDICLGFKSNNNEFGLDSETNDSDNTTLTDMRSVNFALPGGVVGRQAIFSIVENIIRNAAKHNNIQSNLNLVFEAIDGKFLKDNYSSDDMENRIASPLLRELYAQSDHVEDIIIFSVTDNQECSNDTVKRIREALRQEYIGEDSQTNKGIKEIRISSTWLRGEDDESMFARCPITAEEKLDKGKKAPIVAVEKSKEGSLRYLIGLRKTYEFALVYSDEESKDGYKGKFDLDKGCYQLKSSEAIKDSDTCFGIIIAENKTVFDSIRPYVTNRCVNYDDIKTVDGEKITADMVYQTYAQIDEESPCIYIDDDRYGKIEYGEKIKIKGETEPEENYYLYRSHHFSENDFRTYWISHEKYEKALCIDGISGDNSSDRLVRRETLDEIWYYNHLHALKSRVAIFDERLFQIVHGLDESDMTEGSYAVSKFLQKCEEQDYTIETYTDESLVDLARNKFGLGIMDSIKFKKLYGECLNGDEVRRNEMMSFLGPFRFNFKDGVDGKKYTTAAYAEKGVFIYTIIPLGCKECLIVGNCGYDYENIDRSNVTTPVYKFRFTPIARVLRDEKGDFKAEKCKESSIDSFDYLSIHQGLIDKMYAEFEIDDNNSNCDEEKKELITALYDCFMGTTLKEDGKFKKNIFLPRLTIHSGRGHITKQDMPINQPFLQYSAIEHAALDCKYSLVELLDFAKYKKS